jgi:formylglycine-generating enzyme required for sulfatase activity
MKFENGNLKNLKEISNILLIVMAAILISTGVYAQKPVIEWVSIPEGTFLMGSPPGEKHREADEIQHNVTLKAFKMSKFEITFEQYDAYCDAKGVEKPDDEGWGRENRPVINVNWNEARAFADWMGCRLPTEAEWEYACRATTTTLFNVGDTITSAQANLNGNYPFNKIEPGVYEGKTDTAGTFQPNAWGLYDMHGNVWEWCSDWYGEYMPVSQSDPKGPKTGSNMVRRGGSWYGGEKFCRSANRNFSDPIHRYNFIGFRLVTKN